MQLLTETDDEVVSSDEDDDVAPNERPLWIDGRGLIMFGQHKVGINGAREADNPNAKFPGLTFLREHFGVSTRCRIEKKRRKKIERENLYRNHILHVNRHFARFCLGSANYSLLHRSNVRSSHNHVNMFETFS